MFRHFTKEQQQLQYLFDGKFVENKPIPFPSYPEKYAYSNLFYWAHLVALETAEFPLHPHKGFEIMTFVLNGSLEHFDTATNVWTPIGEGGFQVIQAGSGVSHSERIAQGAKLFQIWFDPDFSKTLKTAPSYKDYDCANIVKNTDGRKVFEYIGDFDAVPHQTQDIRITRELFSKGTHVLDCDQDAIYSIYVIGGGGQIDEQDVKPDDYLVIDDTPSVKVSVLDDMQLFIIKTPKTVPYKTVNF